MVHPSDQTANLPAIVPQQVPLNASTSILFGFLNTDSLKLFLIL